MSQSLELLKSVLDFTFKHNLVFFAQQFPHLFEKFKEYDPQNFKIELDQEGRLNIFSRSGPIYSDDPKETSLQQVDAFLKNPIKSIYRLMPISKDDYIFDYIHIDYIGKLAGLGFEAQKKSDQLYPESYEELGRYMLFSVIGTGLGYHLEKLKETEIDHLYIYEPEPDMFYASLFMVDYKALVEHFTQVNKSITILVDKPATDYIEGFQKLFARLGNYRGACLPVYKHYSSPESEEALNRFKQSQNVFYGGFGFFEDEVVSLKHTGGNIENQSNFLTEGTRFPEEMKPPVFICGSGPSLDEAIEVIKENQDRALVISCGTSLLPLQRHGIIPDYHIEIERTEHVYDVLNRLDDVSILKKTTLIGMNTLYPEVVKLFGDHILFQKPNDGGTDLLRVTKTLNFAQIFATNPTVTNGAMGVFNYLGSGDIYLFGCDYGYKDAENHHSKSSGYYSNHKDYRVDNSTKLKRKGNFDGEVFTNHVFDWARFTIEYSIKTHIRPEENKTVFNCSDGAFVEGAEPLRAAEIELDKVVDKVALKQFMKQQCQSQSLSFDEYQTSLKARAEAMFKIIDEITSDKFLNIDFEPKQVIDILNRAHLILMQQEGSKEIFSMRMLKGSLIYSFSVIVGYLYLIRDQATRTEFLDQALPIFYNYLQNLKSVFIEELQIEGLAEEVDEQK